MGDVSSGNVKVRILGAYLLVLGVLQIVFTFAEQIAHTANWLVWGRADLIIVVGPFMSDDNHLVEHFVWIASAWWLIAMSILMLRSKPWLRTYLWVESILALPTMFVLFIFIGAGPSFHTGSRADHLRMILVFLATVVFPVVWAWFLRREQAQSEETAAVEAASLKN